MAVVIERERNGGTQVIHKFENGYGASVVRAPNIGIWGTSYGYDEGLYELAVLVFHDDSNDYNLIYTTPITNDVLGHLTEEDVTAVLARIETLEAY